MQTGDAHSLSGHLVSEYFILGFATYLMGTPMILPCRVCPFDYTAFAVGGKVGIP